MQNQNYLDAYESLRIKNYKKLVKHELGILKYKPFLRYVVFNTKSGFDSCETYICYVINVELLVLS